MTGPRSAEDALGLASERRRRTGGRTGAADAVVIGAGPNGLVAANVLADAGWDVLVLEAAPEPGGAVRTGELTLPGFRHDLFSGFYPLAELSPAMRGLGLEDYGLVWRRAPIALAHPTPDGRCAAIGATADETAETLGGDGRAWLELMRPFEDYGSQLIDVMLGPVPALGAGLRLARAMPRRSGLELARLALLPVRRLIEERFGEEGAALLLGGNALQTDVSPEGAGSGLMGFLVSALAQHTGNPAPAGGASQLTAALVRRLEAKGGAVRCGETVEQVVVADGSATGVRTTGGEVVRARRAVLADVSAPALYGELLAAADVPAQVARDIARFDWDPATVKVDWALSKPVPWTAPAARRAANVNIADSLDELSQWANELARGVVSERPFLLVGQHSPLDATRQPEGCETVSAYARVPRRVRRDAGGEISGRWDADDAAAMVARIEGRLEERAPGFGSLVLGRHVYTPPDFARENANVSLGSVNGGTAQLHQQLFFRPTPGSGRPATFVDGLFLASSSAHPGGGVHGACGANAARAALGAARVPPAMRTAWRRARRR